MIDAVAVADQRVRDAAEIEQAVPVGIIARQTGDLKAKHNPYVSQSYFRCHASKPGTLG